MWVIEAAHKGRVSMLAAIFGGDAPDEKSKPPLTPQTFMAMFNRVDR